MVVRLPRTCVVRVKWGRTPMPTGIGFWDGLFPRSVRWLTGAGSDRTSMNQSSCRSHLGRKRAPYMNVGFPGGALVMWTAGFCRGPDRRGGRQGDRCPGSLDRSSARSMGVGLPPAAGGCDYADGRGDLVLGMGLATGVRLARPQRAGFSPLAATRGVGGCDAVLWALGMDRAGGVMSTRRGSGRRGRHGRDGGRA